MNTKSKLRRLKFLMHKHSSVHYSREELAKMFFQLESSNLRSFKGKYDLFEELLELYRICDELDISEKERNIMWNEIISQKVKDRQVQRLKPQKETRDNKGIKVGSGGSNRNKIRYPSKKRSRRVWKMFYEMFPHRALMDGWDGKTSKRMK